MTENAQAVEKIERELRDHIARYCTNKAVANHCNNRLDSLLSAVRNRERIAVLEEVKKECDYLKREGESYKREFQINQEDLVSALNRCDALQSELTTLRAQVEALPQLVTKNEQLNKDLKTVLSGKDWWRDLAQRERQRSGEICDLWRDVFCDVWPYLPTDFRAEFEQDTRKAVESGTAHPDAWRVLAAISYYEKVRRCQCESCNPVEPPNEWQAGLAAPENGGEL